MKQKKILVMVTHTLSEINVLFPFFSALLDNKNHQVKLVFTVKKIYEQYTNSSFYLYCEKTLGISSELNYIPNKFDFKEKKSGFFIHKVFKRILYFFSVLRFFPRLAYKAFFSDILMHEFSNQHDSTKVFYLIQKISNKPIFTYHHGNEISIAKTSYGFRKNSSKNTILLFDSHNAEYMKSMGYKKNVVVGYPIFFKEWLELVNNYCHLKSYDNPSVLIYSRHVNEKYMDMDKYIYLLTTSLKVIREKFQDIQIVIKPHPREDINFIKEIISNENIANVSISFEHPAVLAKNAIMAITFWGSVILESLSMEVPTVEYYKEANRFREDYPNGSNYKAVGIDSVSSEDELRLFIDSVISNNYHFPEIIDEFKKIKNTTIFL